MQFFGLPGLLIVLLLVSYGWVQPHSLGPLWGYLPVGLFGAWLVITTMDDVPPVYLAVGLFGLALLLRAIVGGLAASDGISMADVASSEEEPGQSDFLLVFEK